MMCNKIHFNICATKSFFTIFSANPLNLFEGQPYLIDMSVFIIAIEQNIIYFTIFMRIVHYTVEEI